MPIIVKINAGRKDFEKCPEGLHNAVLVDIVDLGEEINKFKAPDAKTGLPVMVQKVRFVWMVEEKDTDGRRFLVFEKFTNSLDERASMRKRIDGLGVTGIPTTGEYDIEQLLGLNARLVIQHNAAKDGSGDIYANVASTLKPIAGKAHLPIPSDYVRFEDRPKKTA